MKLSLNHHWKLLYRDLDVTARDAMDVLRADDYLDAGSLPIDAHMPLIKHGIIKDPVVADYCYESEWMERKSWWFRNEFDVSAEQLRAGAIRLELESLDLFADVFINGKLVGTHQSCHFPFVKDVKRELVAGKNTLLVRLTMGAERVSKGDYDHLSDYICTEYAVGRGDRGEKARAMLRKPQYVYGWDWGPRVGTVGIVKNAWLHVLDDVAVTRVAAVTLDPQKDAKMRFELEFESLLLISTQEVDVTLDVRFGGKTVLLLSKNVLAESGANFVDFEATIKDAKLWWPSGAGNQPLYELVASVQSKTSTATSDPIRFGVRTVSLDMAKYQDDDRRFAVAVNGVPIYCKGADWIPADSVYARVDRAKYETLLKDAKDCNFNMLRIWGGGNYERDEFYDLCDELGILLWHDFMFACSMYPDDQPWFVDLATREIDHQTKYLRNHPSIALWCGNNECQWIFEKYFEADGRKYTGGLTLYNDIMPRIIRNNCPETPYWRSSPYGGRLPNDNEVGDRHHWHDCTMSENMADRVNPEAYDRVTSRFVSEYGYIGPCSEATITKYYDGKEWKPGDAIWNLHNNTFEKATVPEGIRRHYTDPETLDIKDYLQYARLVQGLMYGYSLEAIRFYPRNDGALFWMYNDTWGEVGWTIIDYYLDRKPSFYYVKRAFAPVKLILRSSQDKKRVLVCGVNDTAAPVEAALDFGYQPFDGSAQTGTKPITIAPFSKSIVHEFPMPEFDETRGVVFARMDGAPLATLRLTPFRLYKKSQSTVSVTAVAKQGNDYQVTLTSSGFSHAVSFGLPADVRLDDEYFDMLPGDTRTITIRDAATRIDQSQLQPRWL